MSEAKPDDATGAQRIIDGPGPARAAAPQQGGPGGAPRPSSARETAPLEADRPRTDWAPVMRGGLVALLAVAGLLVLALLLNSLGLLRAPGAGVGAVPTRELILDESAGGASVLGGAGAAYPGPPAAAIPPPGPPPGPPPPVGAQFEGFYNAMGGERILGRPLAEAALVNGRQVQWFERARVEHWPEHAGTPFELQLGRIGVEFTSGRAFAGQSFFVSGPELRFFPETGHGVGGAFLRFYDANGGLFAFGLPISEEFDEVLPDGRAYRVQYFERARMEYHPELAGTPYEVQLGLLGTALYRNEARPNTVQPIPTQVPMP